MSVNGLFSQVQGISTTTQGLDDVVTRLSGPGSYFAQLQPASFSGVAFGVLASESSVGRRNAVHLYPYRDEPWVEDMGRQPREFTISGWLIGDDVISRREALIKACELKVAGDLVHPTYGKRRVALMSAQFSESADEGRVIRLSLRFIEQGARTFPKVARSGAGAVADGAKASNLAAAQAFAAKTAAALKTGANAANAAAKQAAAWAAQAQQAGRDVNALMNLTATLPGEFGRLVREARGVILGDVLPVVAGTTLRGLQGTAAANQAAVENSTTALGDAGTALGPTTTDAFVAAAQATATAVALNSPTPGDALRGLATLAQFEASGSEYGGGITTRDEAARAFRRAAVVAMATVVVKYKPASADDAIEVRDLVAGFLAAEMLAAGDSGDDAVYAQLRALRTVVVDDLNSRGARLPSLVTVRLAASMPSLVLAQQMYQDATRESDLVQRAAPVHPAFMPQAFKALSE